LGKAYEDRGEHEDAFTHYRRGNTVRRRLISYDADAKHEETQRHKAFFTREYFAAHQEGGSQSDEPIFIVGLPRAGSTLIEQILASHSQVDGTQELPDIIAIARRLSGKKKDTESDQLPRHPG